jgi:hypothetical protein
LRIRSKRIVAIVIVVVALPVLACAGMLGYLLLRRPVVAYLHSAEFESTGWKTQSRDDGVMWPTRLRMVDDLLKRNLLGGRSRTQVEELLGRADDPPYFRAWDLVYYLGPERGLMGIDSEWLVVRFDGSGKVAECRVVHD